MPQQQCCPPVIVTDTYNLPVPSGSSLPVTYTVDRDNDILVVS
jgi:hypothetical protein